jgi:hypothetical protein
MKDCFYFTLNLLVTKKQSKMNKYQIVVVVLLMAWLCSCKEDPEYPVKYTSCCITAPEIRVFTKDGEIASSSLTNDIISRYEVFFPELDTLNIEGKIIATYTSANSVELQVNSVSEEKARVAYEYEGLIYWENQDTAMCFFPYDEYINDLLVYTPLHYEEYNIPTSTGFSTVLKLKDCYYVFKNNGNLKIPMVDYIYYEGQDNVVLVYGGLNNEFDESSISGLGADTIVVREYSIELE